MITAAMLIAPMSNLLVYAAVGPNVTDHTQEEIRNYINNSGVKFSDPTEFSVQPVNPTERGELATSSKQSALKVLNNIRYIAGLNEVSLNSTQGDLAQAAAFIDYVVGKLTHYPDQVTSKPDDMSDNDWNAGIQGCLKTNIARGQSTLNAAVYKWTFDDSADNIDAMGHRRWVLNPKMGTTGFGSAGAYHAMYSPDNSGTGSQTRVAWPAKNTPVDYFSSAVIPWTISSISISNASNIRVTLTRVKDGKVWNFSGAESYSTSAQKYFNAGSDYIVFRPDEIDAYRDGDKFHVEITGAGSDISYDVNFFSIKPMTGIKFSKDTISLLSGGTASTYLQEIPSDTSDSIDSSLVTYSIQDTDVATVDNKGVITAVGAGRTKITATYKDFTATADVVVTKPIADCTMQIVSNYVEYTGSPVLPKFTVTDGDYTLIEGTDYEVIPYYSGDEVINADDSSFATIQGIGNYSGKRNNGVFFQVTAKRITADMVTLHEASYVYDGKEHSPDVTLEYNGMTLEEGTDYTITKKAGTNRGTYKQTITGKGNYSGTYNASMTIEPLTITADMFTVDDSDLVYSGASQTPVVTGKAGDLDLAEGTHYTISCDNAVNAGDHSITITGKGNCNGEITFGFEIKKAAMDNSKMPKGSYTVPYLTKTLENSIIDVDNWEFEQAGANLEVGTKTFKAEYVGSDAGNYSNETMDVVVTREECKHPDASVEIINAFEAKCEESGYTGDKYCNDCRQTIESGTTVPALDHNWDTGTITTNPTCTEKGVKTISCERCDKTRTEEVAALGHDLAHNEAVDPTCNKEGINEYWYCDRCEKYFNDERGENEITKGDTVVPKAPHSFGPSGHVEAKAPDCTTDGNIEYWVCNTCGGFFDSNDPDTAKQLTKEELVEKALGHTWGEWVTLTEPTTKEEGVKERECAVCSEKETAYIPCLVEPETVEPETVVGTDGTPVGEGASVEAAEKAITGMRSDSDPKGTVFGKLTLRSNKQTNTSISLKWNKVAGASKYYIYGNKCGKTNHMIKQKAIGGTSLKVTKVIGNNNKSAKLKKGTYYKFIVVAADKSGKVLSTSKIIHISTKGGKTGNYKSVTTKAKKNKVSIKKGKTFKLAAKGVVQSEKLKVKVHRKISYEASNKKIATVNAKGIIKGVKKGTCYVYVYTQSGTFAKIKVTVK